MSKITPLLPAMGISAVSAAPGTWLGDQLAAALQFPAAEFVQVIVAAYPGRTKARGITMMQKQCEILFLIQKISFEMPVSALSQSPHYLRFLLARRQIRDATLTARIQVFSTLPLGRRCCVFNRLLKNG
jgi:hypothetical protein